MHGLNPHESTLCRPVHNPEHHYIYHESFILSIRASLQPCPQSPPSSPELKWEFKGFPCSHPLDQHHLSFQHLKASQCKVCHVSRSAQQRIIAVAQLQVIPQIHILITPPYHRMYLPIKKINAQKIFMRLYLNKKRLNQVLIMNQLKT